MLANEDIVAVHTVKREPGILSEYIRLAGCERVPAELNDQNFPSTEAPATTVRYRLVRGKKIVNDHHTIRRSQVLGYFKAHGMRCGDMLEAVVPLVYDKRLGAEWDFPYAAFIHGTDEYLLSCKFVWNKLRLLSYYNEAGDQIFNSEYWFMGIDES